MREPSDEGLPPVGGVGRRGSCPSWRYALSADGARTTRLTTADEDLTGASAEGTASDLILAFYDRLPLDSLHLLTARDQG